MPKSLKPLVRIATLILLLCPLGASGKEISKLHLLMISNGHYADQSSSVADFSGAHVSAGVINALLDQRIGLASSTLLRSRPDRLVTREDVFAALEDLKQRIGNQRDTYLMVYYVGHGFGEGIAWNYFLQPGNVEFPTNLNDFDVVALAEQLIYLGDLNDRLKTLQVPYTLLVDACYEGEAESFQSPVLTGKAVQNLTDVAGILKFMNQFRSENPVVFSAEPGGTVRTVPHPTRPTLPYHIGPLARRLLMSAEQWPSGTHLQVADIIRPLQSASLDDQTKVAVSFPDFGPNYRFRKRQAHPRVNVHELWGSATVHHLQALRGNLETDNTAQSKDTAETPRIASATVAILGSPQEYVSDGKDYIFTSGIETIRLESLSDREIALEMELDGESWSFAIAAPEGERFEARHYGVIARHPFQEGRQAGLAVTGAGRGCNEISGDFQIKSLNYTDGIPSAISLAYRQFCDDERTPIRGTLVLETLNNSAR